MKKALALVLALVLALSMAVSAFALDFVELKPADKAEAGKVEIPVVDADNEHILYTTLTWDEDGNPVLETVYYVALPFDVAYTDVKVTANGNLTAELVEFNPDKMVIVDENGNDVLTYSVLNLKGEAVATELSYEDALSWEAYFEKENKVDFKVVCEQTVNVIKMVVANNFSAHYTEGTLKVEAKLGKKDYVGKLTVINDVTIFEYEQVKWAANNFKTGAALQLGEYGYSDYLTDEFGYGFEYEYENLREDPFALVVSTTAFRAIEGKNLKLNILAKSTLADARLKMDDLDVNVVLKEIAKDQKGVNFFAWADVKFDKKDNLESVSLIFKGDQVIKGEFEITIGLPFNWYELRELFGVKVEEDDIISYYLVDGNGKVVGGKEVDYMTADLTESASFTVKGANQKLGEYSLVLEVPAAEAGESNPNTGAESVVGVVAALAVVSVATAAAVSLKK